MTVCVQAYNEYLFRIPFSLKQSICASENKQTNKKTNTALKPVNSFNDDLETQLTPASSFIDSLGEKNNLD